MCFFVPHSWPSPSWWSASLSQDEHVGSTSTKISWKNISPVSINQHFRNKFKKEDILTMEMDTILNNFLIFSGLTLTMLKEHIWTSSNGSLAILHFCWLEESTFLFPLLRLGWLLLLAEFYTLLAIQSKALRAELLAFLLMILQLLLN